MKRQSTHHQHAERLIHCLLSFVLLFTSIAATATPVYAAPLAQTDAEPDWLITGEADGNSLGTALAGVDVNGDGYSDLVVSAMGYPYGDSTGRVLVYHGGPDGLGAEPDWTATGVGNTDRFGAAVANAGDMNGDGYDDLLIGAPGVDDSGSIYLYLGGADGLATEAVWEIGGQTRFESLGTTLAAGDFNGDGWPDVVAGATEYNRNTGMLYVYYNSGEELADHGWQATGANYDDQYGTSLAVGDVNGDGYADISAAGPGERDNGFAVLYLGGEDGVADDPFWVYVSENSSERYGSSLAIGDTDGDGYDDLLVGIRGYDVMRGAVILYPGTEDGITMAPTWQVQGEARGDQLGQSVGFIERMGEDGVRRHDILAGAHTYPENDEIGRLYRFESLDDLPETLPTWRATGSAPEDYFGEIIAPIGDINGDGTPDLAVAGPGHDGARGVVAVFYGTNSIVEPTTSVATTGATISVAETEAQSPQFAVTTPEAVQPDGVRLFVLSPDGEWLVGERDGEWFCVYATDDMTEQNCANWKEEMTSVDYATLRWSPDNRYVALTEDSTEAGHEPDLWLYDVTEGSLYSLTDDDLTGLIMRLEPGAAIRDTRPTWSPNGLRLAFARSDGFGVTSIQVLAAESIEPMPYSVIGMDSVFFPTQGPMHWLPDGNGLIYSWRGRSDDEANGVWLTAADKLPVQLLAPDPEKGVPAVMGLSPDGTYGLLWYRDFDEGYHPGEATYAIWHLESDEITPLAPELPDIDSFENMINATLSPNGNQLLYSFTTLGDGGLADGRLVTVLAVRDLDSGGDQQLLTWEDMLGSPRVLELGMNWGANNTIFTTGADTREGGWLFQIEEIAAGDTTVAENGGDPRHPNSTVVQLMEEAIALAKAQQYTEAIALFDRVLEIDPNVADAYAFRGLAHMGIYEGEAGVEDLIQAFLLDPTLGDKYLPVLDSAVETVSKGGEAFNNRGRAYLALGEYNKAMIDFSQAIARDPEVGIYYANRGIAYSRLGNATAAFEDYDTAIDLDPTYFRAYYDRGVAYHERGDVVAAFEDFTQAIELNPEYMGAYNNRAGILMAAGEYEAALVDYNVAIELDSANVDLYENRGAAHYQLEQYDAALADFNQALDLDPEQATIYRRRGLIYYNLDELETALADFDRAIDLDAEYYDAYLSRGLTHYVLENFAEAAADLEYYLTWTPDAENRDQLNAILLDAVNQVTEPIVVPTKESSNASADDETMATDATETDTMVGDWPQIIYVGGGEIAEITEEGDVWIYSNYVGNLVNGDIWVEGNDEGDFTADGEVWKAGDKIGDITSDGEIWVEGDLIGEIEAAGTIWYDGNPVGYTQGGRWEYAAILLFYGFYDEFFQ